VLLTNPDMLHYALLAYHAKWLELWRNLRFVVIDEMHTYRGVFGSHVAQIIRRLQRICQYHGPIRSSCCFPRLSPIPVSWLNS